MFYPSVYALMLDGTSSITQSFSASIDFRFITGSTIHQKSMYDVIYSNLSCLSVAYLSQGGGKHIHLYNACSGEAVNEF